MGQLIYKRGGGGDCQESWDASFQQGNNAAEPLSKERNNSHNLHGNIPQTFRHNRELKN